MKKIYLDVAGRMHSLYEQMLSNPPAGYQFVSQRSRWDRVSARASRINMIYALQDRMLGKVMPVNLAKSYLERFKQPPKGIALTYATGHLVFRKEIWVLDLEFVTQLAGYSARHFKAYRKLIERTLRSQYCRKIICWTEAAKKTILLNMDCEGFKNKISVVPLAVNKNSFVKDENRNERTKLLFVGSANIAGEFEYKGGKEVLEAFISLSKTYNNLELVIRSDIPQIIKAKYGHVQNIRVLEKIVPWGVLEQEFKTADIFLFPAHSTPGLALLDAMSYELPVITTDVWANPEMVDDGRTGFVIARSENVPYYTEDFIPNWDYRPNSRFMKAIQQVDHNVVSRLIEKISILIENKDLRRKMGKAGRQEIENGKFSLSRRNEELKKIFDEATANDNYDK